MQHGLHFDQSRRTGVVFHMISCLTECGRIGMTAVGDSPEEAWRIYQEAEAVLQVMVSRGHLVAFTRVAHSRPSFAGVEEASVCVARPSP